MFRYDELDGVIFDVDETLLDTGLHDRDNGLHEQARLQALYEAGKRHDLPQLLKITPHENLLAFLEASVHTLEGAVWTALYRRKAVDTLEINYNDPLLQEIVLRKDELYEHLLRTQGKPVAGAVAFVQALAAKGVPLAIASTAIRRDIDIFLETSGLAPCFPPERIISKADVQHPKPHPEAFDMAFRHGADARPGGRGQPARRHVGNGCGLIHLRYHHGAHPPRAGRPTNSTATHRRQFCRVRTVARSDIIGLYEFGVILFCTPPARPRPQFGDRSAIRLSRQSC
jgi:beta-phosphoglucomutase-like phosphatase (HAD superfamily)